MSVIGDNIRALRKREKITQTQLAADAGVTRETVVKWEAGTITSVREKNLARIRAKYGLTDDDLRSKESGLAAQMRDEADAPTGRPKNCLELRDINHINEQAGDSFVELPPNVALKHPNAFVVETANNHVSRLMGERCHAVIDPTMACENGKTALVELADGTVGFWNVSLGSTKIMLSPYGAAQQEDDLLVSAAEVRIVGVVVWWQAISM